ncbi:sulfurtransferase [Flavobacterium sp. LM5]|uniref:rhodanese-like domain-containing protein n=1 Tax=Flavobacterium sp. LM5 TaxID=1938610 RepID=UPI0009928847|nr:rhodanese-like domain-containing protein [Flavobacterium sp. LM5]OOV29370.1 sulfurtransferase [Flavobacterium sp. LM5]
MITFLKRILGLGPTTNYKALLQQGAIIIDVRSKGEYNSGHIQNSLNIPVDALRLNLGKLKNKNQIIITCCASGMRSASAKSILKANGFSEVYNGGGWASLKSKL